MSAMTGLRGGRAIRIVAWRSAQRVKEPIAAARPVASVSAFGR
ncbi:hypothetical protein [Streptomyces phaeoluteigriseus]|nr:hypothetical protein [Streptomyces phaeoluteigriseus]